MFDYHPPKVNQPVNDAEKLTALRMPDLSKTMDKTPRYAQAWQQEELEHDVKLALDPAWKKYVWAKVNQMAKESEVWANLPAMLVNKVKEIQNDKH